MKTFGGSVTRGLSGVAFLSRGLNEEHAMIQFCQDPVEA
jgi:hypothetical protein